MEHEWGRNVLVYGLPTFWGFEVARFVRGWSMCSRMLNHPAWVLTNAELHTPPACIRMQILPDADGLIRLQEWPIIPGHPHFPFGHAVEPDAPV